ncbi:MAG: ribosome maturation factor RimP [Clostridia bacterium]|nr:ribosome maturation factor RimP [Clostridia bacterium]
MADGKVVAAVREAVEKPVADLGYELVDVEFVKEGPNKYLRLYIDKEGGITIDDCVAVNDVTDPIIDRLDPIDEPYIFEVSSPGLDRPLKTDRDFERTRGKKVDVSLFKAVDGAKQFTGIVTERDASVLVLDTGNGKTVTLDRKNVASVKLTIEF